MILKPAILPLIGFVLVISTRPLRTEQPAVDLPGIPNTPSPANGAVNVPVGTSLDWQGSGATLGYDLYLGTTTSPKRRLTVMATEFTPDLRPSTTYFWRLVARNSHGKTSGPLWRFTTASSSGGPPPPCAFTGWTLENVDAWSACRAPGERTRNELWTREVVAGRGCGPVTQTRVPVQACTPAPAAPPPPPSPYAALLEKSDLVYEGAFRVPAGTGTNSYEYGGTALTYNPARDSLLLVGHDWGQRVGEISVPAPGTSATIGGLPQATVIQPLTDILAGKRTTIDGDTANGVKIGGLLLVGASVVVTAWSYYDAGPKKQTKTHFKTGQTFSALGPVTGPFRVGIGFQNIVPKDTTRIGGFVSGYMSTIPNAWQSALGGTHLTGQGGGVSILARTSSGPSATVFTASEVGVPNSPTELVMGYPSDSSNPSGPLNRPSLGVWGVNGGMYNGTQVFRGMVFPEGARTILFFGRAGSSFCYGLGTEDQSLHMQPVPGFRGVHYCYDPIDLTKGTHGYPYSSIVWAYDVNDFIAVKQGAKQPWDVVPYATWNFQVPFQSRVVNGVQLGVTDIVGAAYDAAGNRIFVAAARNDGAAPVIHVFRVP